MKLLWILTILLISACSNEDAKNPSNNEQPVSQMIDSSATVVTSKLNVPWDIVKFGKEFYVSERAGRIIHVSENGQKTVMPLKLKKAISHDGEGGLMGFELDPKFENNSFAYVYHSYYEDGMVYNRIVQVRKEENEWQETLELLAGIPGGSIHNGGRLAFSPDGKLFATAGDAGNPENAQSLDTLAGKILRVNTDGSIPDDNPFARSYIYSYGHRNPQGLAWAEDGTMYSTEHGQRAHDEINLIKPGKNYGWPIIQGDEQEEGMERPIFHSGEETWAPSGMSYDSGTLYVAALRGQKMLAFNLETKEIQTVYNHAGRLRGILISGHFIYFITNNTDGRGTPAEDDDKLMKISLNRQ